MGYPGGDAMCVVCPFSLSDVGYGILGSWGLVVRFGRVGWQWEVVRGIRKAWWGMEWGY